MFSQMDKKRNHESMEGNPKSGTDDAVATVLREVDEAKKAKKVKFSDCVLPTPNQIINEEIPEEPQGPILEGMVEMAAEKRVIERLERRNLAEKNANATEDTSMELGANVKDAEENFEAPEDEDADKFEPFNLDDEREHGFFDPQGNYVEYKTENHSADAWLEGVKVDESLAEKTRELAEASAAEGEALSGAETARLQRRIAQLLEDEETVLQGLKRLGGKEAKLNPERKAQFEELTECADILMANGEYEVYSDTKRVFERSAALFEPAPVAVCEGDTDMFGGSDEEEAAAEMPPQRGKAKTEAEPASTSGQQAQVTPGQYAQVAAGAEVVVDEEDTTDYSAWPIGELRRFVEENGDSAGDVVEKPDLINRARKTARRLHLEAQRDPAASGYVYHPQSGYYFNNESGLYFDIFTSGFFNPENSKWYSYDSGNNTYVEWEAEKSNTMKKA